MHVSPRIEPVITSSFRIGPDCRLWRWLVFPDVLQGVLDYDGHTDVYITGYPSGALFHNNGDGTFIEVRASTRPKA